MINAGMGEILALILGGAALFVDFEKLVATVTNEAPISIEMLYPAIPLIVYFCIGMVATTAVSPSLEGKNYWIVQSLPVSKKTLYQGKMLFNMYLTVPFMLISTISIDLSAKVPLLTAILTILMGFALCAFSTTWGCVCGIKHMRLDWENEVEVIKQGAAVAIYLFPNLLASILMIGAAVALGNKINRNLILSGLTVIVSALALVAYKRAVSLAERT
jgi:ABC-2 type transport system permease protein